MLNQVKSALSKRATRESQSKGPKLFRARSATVSATVIFLNKKSSFSTIAAGEPGEQKNPFSPSFIYSW
jgi:hypothetical protein